MATSLIMAVKTFFNMTMEQLKVEYPQLTPQDRLELHKMLNSIGIECELPKVAGSSKVAE